MAQWKNGLQTSFIIPRLQTEIVFDNLRRKQAVFWLLASRGGGGEGSKHMFTVSQSPGEGPDNLFTPCPSERTQMFSWNKVTTLS